MKKIIVAVLIVGVIAFMIIFNLNKSSSGTSNNVFSSKKSVDVEAAIIRLDKITSSVLITGGVKEVSKKDMESQTPIKILKVLVEVGDAVSKGDELFTLDVTSLEDELVQLKLNYEIATLQLERLKSLSTTSSTTGVEIALQLANLSVNSAERALADQTANLEKNQVLLDSGVIAQSDFDAMKKGVVEAGSQLESAQLNLERAQSDIASVQKSNNQSGKSTEIDVKVQMKNLEGLDFSIAKLEKQMADLEALTRATLSGVITAVNIIEGETTSQMLPLLTIVNMDELKIVASIREYDITDLKIGQPVVITGDAIAKEQSVIGEVSFISPIAIEAIISGRQTTAVEVEILVTEGAEFLKPGYTADCEITTLSKEGVAIASYEMFREDKEGNKKVLVIGEENIIEERAVILGITSDFDAEVVEGLEAGEVVITNPSLTLKEGMKVKVTNDLEEEGV